MPAATGGGGSDGPVVVLDTGTGFVKAGFAGDNFPRASFHCMVGRPTLRHGESFAGPQVLKDVMIGEECAEMRHQLNVSYPVANGIVQDWGDMELIWKYTFKEKLSVEPSECKVLLTEPVLNPKQHREKVFETMFEKFGVEACSIQWQAVLALYAQGLMTGIVVDAGDGVTHAIPVVDGFIYKHAVKRMNIAGRDVTTYLVDLLLRRGYAFNRSADFDTVRQIKEKMCYCAPDYQRELKLTNETTVRTKKYELPDGRFITIGPERFQAPEVLFTPDLVGREERGMAELVFKSIQDVDIDNRMSMYSNVVLSGGSTMYPGLPSRLEQDLKKLYLKKVLKGNAEGLKKFPLHIEDPPRRKHIVFLGGAVFADITKHRDEFWVYKKDWMEQGAAKALSKLKI